MKQLPLLELLTVWRPPTFGQEVEGSKTASPTENKETTDSDITSADIYRAQMEWTEVGLARLDVDRRVDLCKALVRLVRSKAPALADSSIFDFWEEVITDPSAVYPRFGPNSY